MTTSFLSNQRLVYFCKKYKKAGVWFGSAWAILFWLIDALWAAYSRRGKAAVGQIRYQWPQTVMLETTKLLDLTGNANYLSVMVSDVQQQTYALKFGMQKQPRDEAAHLLIKHLAQYRATRVFDPKKFPNESPERVETFRTQLVEQLTKKVKSDETDKSVVDYFGVSKSSLPMPKL